MEVIAGLFVAVGSAMGLVFLVALTASAVNLIDRWMSGRGK